MVDDEILDALFEDLLHVHPLAGFWKWYAVLADPSYVHTTVQAHSDGSNPSVSMSMERTPIFLQNQLLLHICHLVYIPIHTAMNNSIHGNRSSPVRSCLLP